MKKKRTDKIKFQLNLRKKNIVKRSSVSRKSGKRLMENLSAVLSLHNMYTWTANGIEFSSSFRFFCEFGICTINRQTVERCKKLSTRGCGCCVAMN